MTEKPAEVPGGAEAFNAAPSDRRTDEQVLIPTYDTVDQFGVGDLERQYPEWRDEVDMDDPELVAVSYIRTQELRRIGRETGLAMLHKSGGDGLVWAMDHVSREVGQQFNAHGIAGKTGSPLTDLDAIVNGGIDADRRFDVMGFTTDIGGGDGAFKAPHPFTEGGIILVGGYGERLDSSGIQTVVLGEEYMRGMDILRSRYPGVHFIAWNEAPAHFTRMYNEAEGANLEFPDPSEPVAYELPLDTDGQDEEPGTDAPTVTVVDNGRLDTW